LVSTVPHSKLERVEDMALGGPEYIELIVMEG